MRAPQALAKVMQRRRPVHLHCCVDQGSQQELHQHYRFCSSQKQHPINDCLIVSSQSAPLLFSGAALGAQEGYAPNPPQEVQITYAMPPPAELPPWASLLGLDRYTHVSSSTDDQTMGMQDDAYQESLLPVFPGAPGSRSLPSQLDAGRQAPIDQRWRTERVLERWNMDGVEPAVEPANELVAVSRLDNQQISFIDDFMQVQQQVRDIRAERHAKGEKQRQAAQQPAKQRSVRGRRIRRPVSPGR